MEETVSICYWKQKCSHDVVTTQPPITPSLTLVERPYRIPVSDRAAFLVILPPTLGILFVFLVSNWYTYLFCGLSVLAGLAVVRIAKKANVFGSTNGSHEENGDFASYTSLSQTRQPSRDQYDDVVDSVIT